MLTPDTQEAVRTGRGKLIWSSEGCVEFEVEFTILADTWEQIGTPPRRVARTRVKLQACHPGQNIPFNGTAFLDGLYELHTEQDALKLRTGSIWRSLPVEKDVLLLRKDDIGWRVRQESLTKIMPCLLGKEVHIIELSRRPPPISRSDAS